MFKTFIAAFCFLLFSVVAVQAAEVKIGVFDMQGVIEKTNVLKDARAAMDKTFGGEKAKLEKQRVALEQQATRMENADAAKIAALQKALIAAKLNGRWKDVDVAIEESLAALSAPRLHRSP